MSLLKIENLNVNYGGIQAVSDLNMHIEQGELVTLIGANGAGKTTTLKTITGLVKPKSGTLLYQDQDIRKTEVHKFVSQGLVMVPEGRGIFPKLTVVENLDMGAFYRKDKAQIQADIEYVMTLFPRLKERAKQLAGTLSGGEQQMVAMGRAILSKPKLLLLDEPSMGLAPIIVQQIFDIIQTVHKEGVTILLVEQNAKLALQISNRGYVMESGKITMADKADVLLNDPRILSAYLGG
ncbi:ABC transporter ATP-binding protein [Vitreoscilla massiliensis]|uniref:ABC transporter ATP-binding protein n=1 Tax=Vitreoscilla massiliensis TaxID=1689272 RepID=A0ABY4E0E4_9NEIS|nr:ABC transporter ATP-binding protein [Vitreoscilla massiliensis]UOO89215.1 ABC transporter ATP-binding protein [Vitreoscilla massiliensis]